MVKRSKFSLNTLKVLTGISIQNKLPKIFGEKVKWREELRRQCETKKEEDRVPCTDLIRGFLDIARFLRGSKEGDKPRK